MGHIREGPPPSGLHQGAASHSTQEPNAGNSRVDECRSQKVPKYDIGHLRVAMQQADGTNRLARNMTSY